MRKGVAVLVISMLAVVAGCSSGGSGNVSPGNGSPKAAVAGYVTDLLNSGGGFCSYLEPSQQSQCSQLTSQLHIHATGTWAFGNVSVQGNEALVVLTGDLCLTATAGSTTTSDCETNSDASKGLPSGSTSFADAYSTALTATNNDAITCIEISGLWWLNRPSLAQGSSSATTVPVTTPVTSPATTTPVTSPATTTPDTSPVTTVPGTEPSTTPGTTPATTG
jgi:hypothetical protein